MKKTKLLVLILTVLSFSVNYIIPNSNNLPSPTTSERG